MYKKNNNYLFEQDSKPRGAPEKDVNVSGDFKARKSKHSLDDQIDALILRYEVSSIVEKDDVGDDEVYNKEQNPDAFMDENFTDGNIVYASDDEGVEDADFVL